MRLPKQLQRGGKSGSSTIRNSRAAANNTVVVQTHGFVQLPPNVLFRIVEYLPLDSQLLLAQTCRLLRNTLESRLQIEYSQAWSTKKGADRLQLSYTLRTRYLAEIFRDAPGHWACRHCMSLHSVYFKDLPDYGTSHVPCLASKSLSDIWHERSDFDASTHYKFQEHHKQILLKYARLHPTRLTHKQRRHLARLLQPRGFLVHGEEPFLWFSAQPRLVMQHSYDENEYHAARTRYELLNGRPWSFNAWSGSVGVRDIDSVRPCPHMQYSSRIRNPPQATREGLFIYNVHEAIRNNGQRETTGSCWKCSMEYMVKAYPSKKRVRICAWYDITPQAFEEEWSESVPFTRSARHDFTQRTHWIRAMHEGSESVLKPSGVGVCI